MLEFFKIFFTILIDEIGDKSELATLGFASTHSKWLTFAASGSALLLATLVMSFLGGYLQARINPKYLSIASGTLFIIIGVWTLFSASRAK